MELKTAIEILEYYQEWRLGKKEEMIHEPKKLTEALDMVLCEVKKPAVSGWVAVTDDLPKALQTVWLTNGKGWCSLGCLIEDAEGWHWAESNGVIYIENGEIVSECESEDLDVKFWHELPKLSCLDVSPNDAKPVLPAVSIDGNGQILQEGDRVFTHGFTDNGFGRHYGTLHRNTEFPEVSDWCIHYDDKEQFAVLDFADVFKA